MVEPVNIKKFVNDILGKKGIPPVKNFAKEFSDGSKTTHSVVYNSFSPLLSTIQHLIWWEDWLQVRKIKLSWIKNAKLEQD